METVVIPVTNHNRWSRQVANVATDLEDASSTRAVVVYQFTDDLESTVDHLDVDQEEVDLDELATRKSGVNEVVETLESSEIPCSVRGVEMTDNKGEKLLSVVDTEDADRIYMYSRKRSPTGKAIFGSELQTVLFNSSVPVVVVPSNAA